MSFGEILRKLRRENDLRQSDVAALLDVPLSTYGGYERDVCAPSFETLLRLGEVYNVNLDYLLGRTHIKTSWQDMCTELHTSQGPMRMDVFLESVMNLSPQNQTELLKFMVFLLSQNVQPPAGK